jgi:hypothetical protein
MKNFIGKYFEDVIIQIEKQGRSFNNFLTKVNDDRYIFHKYNEDDKIIFDQNMEAYKEYKAPLYKEEDTRLNWYMTITYFHDNDKIILKEVFQHIADKHIPNPNFEKELEAGKKPKRFIADSFYYNKTVRKIIITKQGILRCPGKYFKRMPYYSYGNQCMGYSLESYDVEPNNVFNKILKDINLFYRPDMSWSYMPDMYKSLANQECPLDTAKIIHKTFKPHLEFKEGEINNYLKKKEEERKEKERKELEELNAIHQQEVDDLPF